MNLKGQKIVVIGGSSGMGLASAQALAQEDATVVIASRSREKLEAAKARIAGEVETEAILLLIGNGFITGAILDADGVARLT